MPRTPSPNISRSRKSWEQVLEHREELAKQLSEAHYQIAVLKNDVAVLRDWFELGVVQKRILEALHDNPIVPVDIRITCPSCNTLHVDEGTFATKPHKSHTCQQCGLTWKPSNFCTRGVRFLPGTENG